MSESSVTSADVQAASDAAPSEGTKPVVKLPWETPKLEDVSQEVMAQPYIRFT